MTARKPAGARRREIADAALKVIAEQGLVRFTALTVARQVGVSDAALFRHFPSKEAMVLAVIDRVEEILFEGFPPPGTDPIARLGHFFRQRVAVIRANPGLARLVGSEQLAQAAPPEGVSRVTEFRRRSTSFVRQMLAEAQAQRMLAEGVHAEEASVMVLGSLLALAHHGLARASARLPERVWAALERALRGGGRSGLGRRSPLAARARSRRVAV